MRFNIRAGRGELESYIVVFPKHGQTIQTGAVFVMMALAAFVACGVTAFYTHRAAHGRTEEERAAYWIGEKAGDEAPPDAKLPSAADLNMMAEKYFEQQGSSNKQNWDLAFENGYTDGFKKTRRLRANFGTARKMM
jgi:hypothetical protein